MCRKAIQVVSKKEKDLCKRILLDAIGEVLKDGLVGVKRSAYPHGGISHQLRRGRPSRVFPRTGARIGGTLNVALGSASIRSFLLVCLMASMISDSYRPWAG